MYILDFSDRATNYLLREYDKKLNAFASGIPLNLVDQLVERRLGELEDFLGPSYNSKAEQASAEKLVEYWTRDFEANIERLLIRKAFSDILKGKTPISSWEIDVAVTLVSRRARWENLTEKVGIAFPDAFLCYRGVKGIEYVQELTDAWLDDSEFLAVRQHELASWSLSKSSAERFAVDPHAAVIFIAEIPFEQTLIDKWVDGGRFVIPYYKQYEIVAGYDEPDGIVANSTRSEIFFRGKRYTYAEKRELFKLLRPNSLI